MWQSVGFFSLSCLGFVAVANPENSQHIFFYGSLLFSVSPLSGTPLRLVSGFSVSLSLDFICGNPKRMGVKPIQRRFALASSFHTGLL